MLIVARVASFIFAAPFYSTANVPRRAKAGLAILISFLLYRFVVPHMVLEYHTVLGYGILVIKESIAGILLGFSMNICMYILQFVGHLTDVDVGLSMLSLFDPITRINTGFTGTLYQYSVLMILCVTGMHRWILQAFIDSYELLPTGHVAFAADHLLKAMTDFVTGYFIIGFRIFLPVFGVMLLLNTILGVLAKIAPQMNMFTVGMQLKILTGLSVLFLTIGLLPGISDFIFAQMKAMFAAFAGGMYSN